MSQCFQTRFFSNKNWTERDFCTWYANMDSLILYRANSRWKSILSLSYSVKLLNLYFLTLRRRGRKLNFAIFFTIFFTFTKLARSNGFFQVTKGFFQHWFQGKLVQLDFTGQQSSELKMQKLNLHKTESWLWIWVLISVPWVDSCSIIFHDPSLPSMGWFCKQPLEKLFPQPNLYIQIIWPWNWAH